MRFLSVCSGIEAASVAWEPLGWKALAFSEIEAFPRAVLQHHYPDVPLYGDFTALRDEKFIADADVLVGGTPCQAFSVAGLRQSLSDDRGNLSLEFVRLANAIDDLRRAAGRPDAFVCWENVPGVLSVGDNAFGAFLGGLVGSESAIVTDRWTNAGVVAGPRRIAAWRVLDAQHFGVAQRRRRVFVLAVGHSRGWSCADALLSIGNRLSGHPAPRREKGARAASRASCGFEVGGTLGPPRVSRLTTDECINGAAIVASPCGLDEDGETARALTACHTATGRLDANEQTFVAFNLRGREDGAQPEADPDNIAAMRAASGGSSRSYIAFTAKDHGADASDISPTLRSGSHSGSHANAGVMPAVAMFDDPRRFNNIHGGTGEHAHVSRLTSAVRRLTPRECERLMGFPDDYTLIPYRGKPAADGPRYKALGNSMAVPVMAWLGQRIALVEQMRQLSEAA